jgi:hypothetical protein
MGWFNPTRNVFRKHVEVKKHYFRIHAGYGIDANLLRYKLNRNTKVFIMLDDADGTRYFSYVWWWFDKNRSKPECRKGHKPQRVLPVREMKKLKSLAELKDAGKLSSWKRGHVELPDGTMSYTHVAKIPPRKKRSD